MATIEEYRDAFDPGNVFTIPRARLTTNHRPVCATPGAGDCGCAWESTEPTAVISAQVGGGGEPGKAYVGWWFYELCVDGDVVVANNDYRCGFPRTAKQVAAELMGYLIAWVDDDSLSAWPAAALEFARENLDRLSLWAAQIEEGAMNEQR
ncbi:hypothetical protein ACFU99_05765 [Streptomyces sp. NPDC057654]|uniref:hypothetical protein n=1 Tax=Streptomyces sp. NPDC057654 TaxID=3346196 RepID=UPI0036997ED8